MVGGWDIRVRAGEVRVIVDDIVGGSSRAIVVGENSKPRTSSVFLCNVLATYRYLDDVIWDEGWWLAGTRLSFWNDALRLLECRDPLEHCDAWHVHHLYRRIIQKCSLIGLYLHDCMEDRSPITLN